MNLAKRIFLRLYKHIEIKGTPNISIENDSQIGIGSVINASNGRIKLGKGTRIGKHSELVSAKDGKINIKDFSTLYSNCKVLGDVTIERYCVLATNIYMSSGNHFAFEHPELLVRTQDQIIRSKNKNINKHIHIHEDVWIGNGVFISAGVTIGRGAVIGAGTIVTKDVLPYQVIVGNPGKCIKNRLQFSPPTIINAQNQNDRPYFYSGFDHKTSYPKQDKRGFKLLGNGQAWLSGDGKTINIEGTCEGSNSIKFEINEQPISTETVNGNFLLSLELLSEENTLKVDILPQTHSNIYINSISLK